MPRRSRLPSLWLALLLAPTPACFGVCTPSIPEAETECLEDEPAASSATITIVDEDGEELADGTELELDYGPQGGQHFYVSLRVFPSGEPDEFIVASFEGEDGNQGHAEYFLVDGCSSWTAIDGEILQVDQPSATSGIFRVAVGGCDGSCVWDEDGRPTNFVALAEDERDIAILP